jgi:hypothetical protein
MTFNNIDPASNGITGGTGSRITVGHTGVYNIQFSAQVTKTGGSDPIIIYGYQLVALALRD